MPLNTNSTSRIPLSDPWMEGVHFDDSHFLEDKQNSSARRTKTSRQWNVSLNTRGASCNEDDDTSDGGTADSADEDDEDDCDWIASDCDKKRPHRGNLTVSQSVSHKVSQNYKPIQYRRDRSRLKFSSSTSPRTSTQPRMSGSNSRSGRFGSVLVKTAHRSAASFTQEQFLSSGLNTARRNPIRAQSLGSSTSPKHLPYELTKVRQCFGPGCTRAAARPDTKYCSKECGLKLAFRRLQVLLPETLVGNCDLGLPSVPEPSTDIAEQSYKSRLQEIQTEKCGMHDQLVQLEMEHQQLSALIARARESKSDRGKNTLPHEVTRYTKRAEQMELVFCVTCASEVSIRHALRHMEKCFQKMEGNTVFCANQKEQIMGTPLFCDTYDNQAKAYCKRLRVVCEHFKEPKLPPDTICGFPLVRDVFVETGKFCSMLRNKCTRHLGWERLRRARIDIERYRCFIRMDELLQEEQRLHQSIAQRGGILGMLLHRTIDHNPGVLVSTPPELQYQVSK